MRSEYAADRCFPAGRNIALLNGFSAARHALFLFPVLVPYFEDHVGLSFKEVLLTEAAFAATVVLAEVPSGWLADQWRRKNTLMLGAVLWTAGILCLWVADDFAQVVLGQVLMGFALSLQSGADSALLYDSLLCTGTQSQYLKLESRRYGLAMLALAMAAAAAGPLYVWNTDTVSAFSLAAYILSGICAGLLREPPRQRSHRARFNLAAMARTVLRECKNNRTVLWTVLFAGGLMASTKASVWTLQAYQLLLEIDLIWFGPIAAAAFLLASAASQLGPSIDRRVGARAALAGIVIAVVCSFVLGGLFPSPAMIPVLFVATMAYGIADPALKTMANDRVTSDCRATILSLLGLAPQLTFVALRPWVGQVVDRYGADTGYLFLAGFATVTAGLGWLGLSRALARGRSVRV